MKSLIERANILIETLPYIKTFFGKTIVIKYGGKAMVDEELKHCFAQDIVLLRYIGAKPVVVHGGGVQINQVMKKMGKKAEFIDGLRVTDIETMEIVEMVLGGRISSEIVSLINHHGAQAVGLTGLDGKLIEACQTTDGSLTGQVTKINPRVIETLDENGFIPVIAPIGTGTDGKRYNINADTVASEIATTLSALKLILLSDTKGVLKDIKDPNSLISTLKVEEIDLLINDGCVSEGMLPKINACKCAISSNKVDKAHIIDGRIPHSILLELFTDKGIGTQIIRWCP
ncbi:MAG: acetylglutamate kinase [bacterium]|nr:acetylglutamate kinase [bacterium]